MDEARGKVAFELHSKIASNERARRLLMAQNAELLALMYDDKYYKELLGDEDAPWASYLAQLEVFYSRNKINTLVDLHKKYTIELDIDPKVWADVPVSRLMDMRIIVTKTNYMDWFASALSLTSRDWSIEVAKAKGKTHVEDGHTHEDWLYQICHFCGRRHKLQGAEIHDTITSLAEDKQQSVLQTLHKAQRDGMRRQGHL